MLPATGIVISVLPHGGEGEKVKKLIEEDIYPAISDMFVDNREIDANINLVVSDKESVAQWDEKTNTLTVPYEFSYENFLDYPRDIIQRNGIAHELTHYLLNGLAIENGGDYKRVPLWLREGIAEYGAHEYMMFYSGNGMNNSISQVRSDIFADYLMNKNYNYKETVEKNAIKKISWNDYNFEDIESKDHVYYGAAFSFVKYWLQNTNRTVYYPATATPLVELREIFISISTKKLKADGVFSDKEKSNWFKAVNNQLKIKQKLDNKPCSWWEKIFGCKRE